MTTICYASLQLFSSTGQLSSWWSGLCGYQALTDTEGSESRIHWGCRAKRPGGRIQVPYSGTLYKTAVSGHQRSPLVALSGPLEAAHSRSATGNEEFEMLQTWSWAKFDHSSRNLHMSGAHQRCDSCAEGKPQSEEWILALSNADGRDCGCAQARAEEVIV